MLPVQLAVNCLYCAGAAGVARFQHTTFFLSLVLVIGAAQSISRQAQVVLQLRILLVSASKLLQIIS